MHTRYFQRLGLRAPENDGQSNGATTGGGTTAPVALTEEFKALDPAKMGIGERFSAAGTILLRGDTLIAERNATITQLRADLSAAQAEPVTLKATIITHEATIAALQKENAEVQASLVKLSSENAELKARETDLEKRSSEKAKEQVRALGFPASKLPGATTEVLGTADEQIAALNTKIAESKDPREKGILANQVWDLMKKRPVSGLN